MPVGFFFVINFIFNLDPGIIACTTGAIFSRFSGARRQARSERGALSPVLSGSPRSVPTYLRALALKKLKKISLVMWATGV